MNRKKGSINFIKNLDKILVFFGLLSNWGIIILSILILYTFQTLVQINTTYLTTLLLPLHLILSIGAYFIIGRSKSFKTGYIMGFILSLLLIISNLGKI